MWTQFKDWNSILQWSVFEWSYFTCKLCVILCVKCMHIVYPHIPCTTKFCFDLCSTLYSLYTLLRNFFQCSHSAVSEVFNYILAPMLFKNTYVAKWQTFITCSEYSIAENIGGRTHWWIWQLMANYQSCLPQIYGIIDIHVLFVSHSLKFLPPNNINTYLNLLLF